MHEYDFTTLNDKEFEHLVIDLLAESWKQHIERFKPGKDQGIDGRFYSPNGGVVIIQCKHYARTGFNGLLRQAKGKEALKVARLAPKRYVLATSVALSPANKQALCDAVGEHYLRSDDVLGQGELNDILGKFPHVERRHYKLYLTSTCVLETVLNKAVFERTSQKIDEAKARLPLYYRTSNHERARAKLESMHSVVITGEPGVGKTTLADQIFLEYTDRGYQPVFVENDLDVAENVWSASEKQVFYFDDFLGRNILHALQGHQDAHVTRFLRRVARDSKKAFLLTSRTNLLNQGKRLSHLFRESNIDRNEFELRIDSLHDLDKAHVLYNHLWVGGMSEEYIDELYKDRRYLWIVRHRNFNPRLIAFITDPKKVEHGGVAGYWNLVQESLKNPADVWQHAFEVQLDKHARDVVALVALNGSPLQEEVLRRAYYELAQRRGREAEEFNTVVQPLVGALLDRRMPMDGKPVRYDLFSPSIGDHVHHRYASDERQLGELYRSLPNAGALNHLRDLISNGLVIQPALDRVLGILSECLEEGDHGRGSDYCLSLGSLIVDFAQDDSMVLQVARYLDREGPELEPLATGMRLLHGLLERAPNRQVSRIASHLIQETTLILDEQCLELVGEINKQLSAEDRDRVESSLRNAVIAYWEGRAGERLSFEDVLREYTEDDDVDAALQDAEDYIHGRLLETGLSFDRTKAEEIMRGYDVSDFIQANREAAAHEDAAYDSWKDDRASGHLEHEHDAAIRDLFDRGEA